MPTRTRLVPSALLALAAIAATAIPSGAAPTTAVTIDSANLAGSAISLGGTLALGDDATGAVTLAEDPSGDAAVSGVGIDIKKVAITAQLATSRLVFTIETHDMPTGVDASAPAYGYTIPISVDGDTAPGYFLGTGNAGSNFPPSAGKWWALCTAVGGSYGCSTAPAGPLTGTMGANAITINVPFSKIQADRGSTIEPSGNVACPGVCSTVWAGLLFNNTGGDNVILPAYKVPGSVSVGIARATTPPASVVTDTPAEVAANGTWTASLAKPSSTGDHVIVARSCWGDTEAPICATTTSPITL